MTSDSDDLEEALRENLKLRHELGAKVDKTKKSSVFAYGVTILEIAVALGPLWVISGHWSADQRCPLCPQERTRPASAPMSA
jgi:hypothetical protein